MNRVVAPNEYQIAVAEIRKKFAEYILSHNLINTSMVRAFTVLPVQS